MTTEPAVKVKTHGADNAPHLKEVLAAVYEFSTAYVVSYPDGFYEIISKGRREVRDPA